MRKTFTLETIRLAQYRYWRERLPWILDGRNRLLATLKGVARW